jgi:hypothetical protein
MWISFSCRAAPWKNTQLLSKRTLSRSSRFGGFPVAAAISGLRETLRIKKSRNTVAPAGVIVVYTSVVRKGNMEILERLGFQAPGFRDSAKLLRSTWLVRRRLLLLLPL